MRGYIWQISSNLITIFYDNNWIVRNTNIEKRGAIVW